MGLGLQRRVWSGKGDLGMVGYSGDIKVWLDEMLRKACQIGIKGASRFKSKWGKNIDSKSLEGKKWSLIMFWLIDPAKDIGFHPLFGVRCCCCWCCVLLLVVVLYWLSCIVYLVEDVFAGLEKWWLLHSVELKVKINQVLSSLYWRVIVQRSWELQPEV